MAETIPERKEERKGEQTFASVSGSVVGVCQLLGMSVEKYNLIMF